MKRILLILVMVLLTLGTAQAASFTITTTAEQDGALVLLRAKMNVGRAIPLTAVQFRDFLVAQWLDNLVAQGTADTHSSLRDRYEAADAATKAQIKTLLGM